MMTKVWDDIVRGETIAFDREVQENWMCCS